MVKYKNKKTNTLAIKNLLLLNFKILLETIKADPELAITNLNRQIETIEKDIKDSD